MPVVTLLADVVSASKSVTDTAARSRKVAILADLLRRLQAGEVPIAVGFLTGVPRQGRVGVGYSTVYGLDVMPADDPSVTISELDDLIARVLETRGGGSAARRRELLEALLSRATAEEGDFVKRLFTGGLRQGALAGVMTDAIAKAAGVPGELTRRALMLSGDLAQTAELAMTSGEGGLQGVGFERASVEWKLDGIRIQVHRRGDEVRIYTRNLNEITGSLPGIADAVRRLPVAQAVFDGEALWMGHEGPAAFQDTVAQIDGDAPLEGVTTFLFDVLHVDGDDLLDTALESRRARLEAVAPNVCSTKRSGRATRASSSRTRARSTPPGGAARPGARSSRCARTTSSCSAPSGVTAGARVGCRTCT
jgi:DNA ligase-1